MDCSPPGSSVHGIFQVTVLEWGAIAFSLSLANLKDFDDTPPTTLFFKSNLKIMLAQ